MTQSALRPHWTDVCKRSYGGSYDDGDVHDIQSVIALMPFIMTLILYWAVYSQMGTTFFNQGCSMDLRFGTYTVPIAALNMFDTIVIVLLIPLFDRWMYPFVENVLHIKLTTLRKIGCGFVIATLSMVVAAIVEIYRLKTASNNDFVGESVCNDRSDVNSATAAMAVNMTIFAQIPQYILIGTSEVFASVASMEFFYSQAPTSMKSVTSALALLTSAFGVWLMALLVPIVNSNPADQWIAHDANHGHLDYYFWLLAGMMAVDTLLFIWYARQYQYVHTHTSKSEIELQTIGNA
jgi:peptide/histidine transporter 3/4